jgi:ribosomal protein S18 acetylase RimI-like enzyme
MNDSPFRIDRINPEEVSLLSEIAINTFSETFSETNTAENMEAYYARCFREDVFLEEMKNPKSWFYFIRKGEIVAGYLKINIDDAQTELREKDGFEIERIYVLKRFYGSGAGAALMEYALKRARELSKRYVWLGVHEKNYRALSFYRKYAFKEFSDHIFMMGNEPQRDILMKLTSYNNY